MSEKKLHRVSVFFGDTEFDELASEAYDVARSPADFLRWLWVEHRRKVAEERAATVRAWALECERKQAELDATVRHSVPAAGLGRNVIERDDDGFPTTVGFPR